jgi:hypothetical protein
MLFRVHADKKHVSGDVAGLVLETVETRTKNIASCKLQVESVSRTIESTTEVMPTPADTSTVQVNNQQNES